MSTDPDQPARIKLSTRNDRDWSAIRARLAHVKQLAETRSQSVHHHRHTMPLGVRRGHLRKGRVPIWAQWSIIGVGDNVEPVARVAGACALSWLLFRRFWLSGSIRVPDRPRGHARDRRSRVGRRFDKPARHLREACNRLGVRRRPARAQERNPVPRMHRIPPSRSKVAPTSSKTRAVLPSWQSSYRCSFDGRSGTDANTRLA